uniref:Secreted protein n=1 Tax=Trichogramma kaykai TaxID=54128 RepID=A0ABD2X5T1_9HYME
MALSSICSCFIIVEANELTAAQPKYELSMYATTVSGVNGCPAAFHKDSRSRANLGQQNSTCSASSSSVEQEGHVARSSCPKLHKYALKHPCPDSS